MNSKTKVLSKISFLGLGISGFLFLAGNAGAFYQNGERNYNQPNYNFQNNSQVYVSPRFIPSVYISPDNPFVQIMPSFRNQPSSYNNSRNNNYYSTPQSSSNYRYVNYNSSNRYNGNNFYSR
jgi:hypothetical protein